jgi:uncharacterized protein (TIGR02145 family)
MMRNIIIKRSSVILVLILSASVSAQYLGVKGVSVDSVWNSDSSWNDGNGDPQKRESRDCIISFSLQGIGMARISVGISIDSGETWTNDSNLLVVQEDALEKLFVTDKCHSIKVRVPGGNRDNVAFRVNARQVKPDIQGYSEVVNKKPGESIEIPFNLRINNELSNEGYVPVQKIYWDVYGDSIVNDSTSGENMFSWTWKTKVPQGDYWQRERIVAWAMDSYAFLSDPETLKVIFAPPIIYDEPITDPDGNVYSTIKIGNQVWTVENWRSTKYADGTPIPHVTGSSEWKGLSTPAYCFYDNTTDEDSMVLFGALYNWYVVNPSNPKSIAPSGWRVPSDEDWAELEEYLGANGYNWVDTATGNQVAKALTSDRGEWPEMKWDEITASQMPGKIGYDQGGNNSSGFSAVPAGFRNNLGTFVNVGILCYWWSSTEESNIAYARHLTYNMVKVYRSSYGKKNGYSVRLVRDAE